MTRPLTDPHKHDAFDASMRELQSALDSEIDRATTRPAPQSPTPRPAVPAAGGGGQLWGPNSQPVTSPLALLAQAADSAHRLQLEVVSLAGAVTGDVSAPRQRQVTKLPVGLLPAVAHLAHEIEQAHIEIARQIAQLKEKLA
jgi:hypothetical protein